MFIPFRLQKPFYIADCYECGKALHFQWPLRRVRKPAPMTESQARVREAVVNAMLHRPPVFNPDTMFEVIGKEEAMTVTIPSWVYKATHPYQDISWPDLDAAYTEATGHKVEYQ